MFLEHLASDNGADMHKYNTLYTHRLNWHVFPPEHYYETAYITGDKSQGNLQVFRMPPQALQL